MNAAEIRSDIKEKYATMGRLCYDEILNSVSHSTELNAIAEDITQLNQKLAAVNEEIRNAKNIAVCPACGTEVAQGASFCPNCGQRFDFPPNNSYHSSRKCCQWHQRENRAF